MMPDRNPSHGSPPTAQSAIYERMAAQGRERVMSSSERKRVVIVGSSFAGLTAAFELKKKDGERHEIVVLDPRPDFTFIPSLIWLPFGGRQAKDVTFALAPVYAL